MAYNKKIRVLVVDDSLLFRETLAAEIAKDFGIEVVGTAADPYEAVEKINALHPDVVTLDVEMPRMSGITFLKKIIPQYPLPVIVVSAVSENVFDALDAGAVDFVTKPDMSKGGMQMFIAELIVKIKVASIAKVSGTHIHTKSNFAAQKPIDNDKIIAIGASTGGTEALYDLLTALPSNIPGILIVQHMPPGFTKLFANRLNSNCKFEVKEAEDGDLVKPGRAILAAGDAHIRITPDGSRIRSQAGEKVSGHCPSVDVLFQSMAKMSKCSKSIGVILTGMGRDGANGLLEMRQNGAYTIGQDEQSCIVYGMPKAAYDIGGVVKQLPLQSIAQHLVEKSTK